MSAAVTRIAGALVEARPCAPALYELAYVGEHRLLAEVVRVRGELATLQVYEDTTGLRLGAPVEFSGTRSRRSSGPACWARCSTAWAAPWRVVAEATGDFIGPGAAADTLDPGDLWAFTATVARRARR